MKEFTFVIIKPDAIQRGLIGEIISRIENKNLKIEKIEMVSLTSTEIHEHYHEYIGKPFFLDLCQFIMSGQVVRMIVSGENAIKCCRLLAGATSPTESQPGTIRGDFCSQNGRNLIHTSDSIESASRELKLHFPDDFLN